jgi:PQQ-like domain
MTTTGRVRTERARFRAGVALVVMVVLAVLAASIAPAAAATKPSVWNEDNGNAAASRFNTNETVLSPATVKQLSHRRGLTVAPAPGDAYCSSQGVDLAAASATVDYVEGNGRVNAYNAATGKVLWSVVADPYYTTYYHSIAVAHGLVILGEADCVSQSDPSGYIQAFDAATGKLVWTQGAYSVLTSMVVSGNYLVETGSTLGSGQSTSAFNVATGARLWETSGDDCYAPVGLAVVVVAAQVVTHTCNQDTGATSLTAYRLATGAVSWTRAVDWSIERGDSGVAGARHLFVKDDKGDIEDLNPATGATAYINATATSVLAVDTTRVYARCGTAVCAFTLTTRAKLWSTPDSSALAAVANGVLYLSDGRMLNSTTGAALARLYSTGSASILFIAGGRVGVVTSARTVSLYGRAGS